MTFSVKDCIYEYADMKMYPSPAKAKEVASCSTALNEVKWCCRACDVMLTSKSQAQEHYFGRRHQNMMKSNRDAEYKDLGSKSPESSGIESSELSCKSEIDIPPCAGRDSILETVVNSDKKTFYSSDLSIYRTPSGKYYCQPCDRMVHFQAQFQQHLDSRKHRHKAGRASLRLK